MFKFVKLTLNRKKHKIHCQYKKVLNHRSFNTVFQSRVSLQSSIYMFNNISMKKSKTGHKLIFSRVVYKLFVFLRAVFLRKNRHIDGLRLPEFSCDELRGYLVILCISISPALAHLHTHRAVLTASTVTAQCNLRLALRGGTGRAWVARS